METTTFNVADYLATRLSELKCNHLFGVAGNYSAPLLDTLLMNSSYGIDYVRVPNELCGGYAADAYARLRGISAVAVTYSVGAFILANPVAGAFVEQVPVVVINGAPSNKEWCNTVQTGLIYSHSLQNPQSNLEVFRNITGAAERIVNATEAPFQIDAALMACISRSTPVYIEILEDVWRAPCMRPREPLRAGLTYVTATGPNSSVVQAVAATMKLVQAYQEEPFFWLGSEIQRQGLQQAVTDLIHRTKIPFTTSVMGKGVLSETDLYFKGVYTPPASQSTTPFLGPDGNQLGNCMIGIGAWMTSKDVAFHNIESDRVVLAAQNGVRVGAYFFPQVRLSEYIAGLEAALLQGKVRPAGLRVKPLFAQARNDEALTYDKLGMALSPWLTKDDRLVVDAGFPLIMASSLPVIQQGGFICQASWLSIGYSMGAAIGASCADSASRSIVIVGDGAFQETCQAVSAQSSLRHGTVVFVIVNGIYGIEQELVNPNPFRLGDQKVHYDDPLFNDIFPYNDLHNWDYEKICAVMGGPRKTLWSLCTSRATMLPRTCKKGL
jgi:indolepyruvate decarboxylase